MLKSMFGTDVLDLYSVQCTWTINIFIPVRLRLCTLFHSVCSQGNRMLSLFYLHREADPSHLSS